MPEPVADSAPARTKPALYEKVLWYISLRSAQVAIQVYAKVVERTSKPGQKATYTKTYPVLPQLVNRVFIPDSHKPDGPLLPLLIDIHGGGMCIGDPAIDDADNVRFAHKHGFCVVSINYRKAPQHGFPTAVEDVARLIGAVLEDPDLPVDKTKVAVIGYSAGGNLALTGPQLDGLHDKIKGAVSFYPVTDYEKTREMRLATATPPPGRSDSLTSFVRAFNWAYLRDRTDYQNPRLSPIYAERSKLPKKLFLLGCEYDMLFAEARDAAEVYAKADAAAAAAGQQVEKKELGPGRTGWTSGDVTFEELKGLEHGFNQRYRTERDAKVKAEWQKRSEEVADHVAEWLKREVYS